MANMHDEFKEYLEKIRLTSAKRTKLKDSRNANRDRIKKHFQEVLKREIPRFHGQGSYSMHTNLNPLVGEYDIDDGVYLQGLGTDQNQWPTAETVHCWIVDAVEYATSEPPTDKSRCVRVRYADDYHIDLPIYAMNANAVPMLFEKGKNPYESDPRAFTEWFNKQVLEKGTQLKPIVRYLKGWRDYKGGGAKIASGLALTILASEQFCAHVYDDEALVRTVQKIVTHVEYSRYIYKPVKPYEDLTQNWTDEQRQNFLEQLKNLRDRGQDALDEEDRSTASGIWRKLLGERFPEVRDLPESGSSSGGVAIKTSVPTMIPTGSARSA